MILPLATDRFVLFWQAFVFVVTVLAFGLLSATILILSALNQPGTPASTVKMRIGITLIVVVAALALFFFAA